MSKKMVAKVDVLLFIRRQEIITVWDLIKEFNYSYWAADKRLRRLKKEELIETLDRGQFIITNQGERRLKYYGI